MVLDLIIPHIFVITITTAAIIYPVHLKYPFKIGSQLNAKQLFALRCRSVGYFLLMLEISMLINYPIAYQKVYLGN